METYTVREHAPYDSKLGKLSVRLHTFFQCSLPPQLFSRLLAYRDWLTETIFLDWTIHCHGQSCPKKTGR